MVLAVENTDSNCTATKAYGILVLRLIGAEEPVRFRMFSMPFPGDVWVKDPKVVKAEKELDHRIEEEKQKFLTALDACPR